MCSFLRIESSHCVLVRSFLYGLQYFWHVSEVIGILRFSSNTSFGDGYNCGL